MTIYEAMQNRHAVRIYEEKEIEESAIMALKDEISKCNKEGGLSIQLIINDKNVFKGLTAYYGGFRGVSNYVALVGPSGEELEETMGYYGERIVLKAQQLGLNTCWVAVTYKKGRCKAVIDENQKLVCVLTVGYGKIQGTPHRSKAMTQLCKVDGAMPEWFKKGMEAAMLAPTAMNKQNFLIVLDEENVRFETKKDKYNKIDLGIVKYHFQVGKDTTLKVGEKKDKSV